MKRLAMVLALACTPAFAEPIFRDGDLTVHFHSAACEHPALTMFLKQHGENPKKATVTYQGGKLEACWLVDEDGDYMIVDRTGNGGFIPAKRIEQGA
jgi:hypothetical protein